MIRITFIFFIFVTSFLLSVIFKTDSVAAQNGGSGAITHALTLTKRGNGTVNVSPGQGPHAHGTAVTLAATPDPGWTFSGWSGDLTPGLAWWDSNWRYRTTISAKGNGHQRVDKPVELALNFTTLLADAGGSGQFDVRSLRLLEIDENGAVLDANVPFQFDKAVAYNATTNAAGTLVFILQGVTNANEERLYHLYFDRTGSSFTPAVVTPQITVTTGVQDEGFASIQFGTPGGAYWYHTEGGGFSSIHDSDGADWLSYRITVGAQGSYRGLPNMIHPAGSFHPGSSGVETTLIHQGPIRATMRSTTVINNQSWEALWTIYPHYVRMTLLQAGAPYWFLYEGTPGGALDANDFTTLSSGTQLGYADVWNGDLPGEEWVYFSDPNAGAGGRSLFLVQHEDDTQPDSYRRLGSTNGMTVWGFGRKTTTESKFLSAQPAQYTFGLVDGVAFGATRATIRAAYKPLPATVVLTEQVSASTRITQSTAPTLSVAMVMDRNIQAKFSQEFYTLTLDTLALDGTKIEDATTTVGGTVSASPAAAEQGYQYGETVLLTATAEPGWSFSNWSGSIAGTDAVSTLTMQGNAHVQATFVRDYYSLTVQLVDAENQPLVAGGTVTATQAQQQRGYRYGETAQIQAAAEPGWRFQGWSGDLTGTALQQTLTLTRSKVITATFAREYYTLAVNVVDVDGNALNRDMITATAAADPAGYRHGENVDLTATAAAGWRFQGWSGDLAGTALQQTLTLTRSKVVTATFAREHYSLAVTVVDVDGNATTQGTVTATAAADPAGYRHGENIVLTATAAAGWRFAGWSGSAVGTEPRQRITVTDNTVVTATFAQLYYPLALFVTDSEGRATQQGTLSASAPAKIAGYTYGEIVTLTATAASGWHFQRWQGDLDGHATTAELTVDGSKSVTAIFAPNRYGFRTNILNQAGQPVAAGSVTLSQPLHAEGYHHDEAITATAHPNPGWQFIRWAGVLSGTAKQRSFTIDAIINGSGGAATDGTNTSGAEEAFVIDAIFQEITYTVTSHVSATGGGTVVVSPSGPYPYGAAVTVTATPTVGWHFVGWHGALSGQANPATLQIDSNKILTATFAPNQYQLVVGIEALANGGHQPTGAQGQITVTPLQQTYTHGQVVTLSATPAHGYRFGGWFAKDAKTLQPIAQQKELIASTIQVVVTGDILYHARFESAWPNRIYLPFVRK